MHICLKTLSKCVMHISHYNGDVPWNKDSKFQRLISKSLSTTVNQNDKWNVYFSTCILYMYILVSPSPPCPQVSAHNKLVQLVNSQGKDAAFHCWLPSTPLTVDVREFSTSDALFPNHDPHKLKEQILNMIRSRCLSTIPKDPSGTISVTTMASRAMWDFSKLESDVVCYYLAGKPFISNVESTLRRPFRFRGYKLDSSTVTSG